MFSSLNRILDSDDTASVPIIHRNNRTVSYRFEITPDILTIIISTLLSVSRDRLRVLSRGNQKPVVKFRFVSNGTFYSTQYMNINRALSVASLLFTVRFDPAATAASEQMFSSILNSNDVGGSGYSGVVDELIIDSGSPAYIFLDFKFPRSTNTVDLTTSAANRLFNVRDLLPNSRVQNVINRVGSGIFERVASPYLQPMTAANLRANNVPVVSNNRINIANRYAVLMNALNNIL